MGKLLSSPEEEHQARMKARMTVSFVSPIKRRREEKELALSANTF